MNTYHRYIRLKMGLLFFLSILVTDLATAQTYVHPANTNPGFIGESTRFMFYGHYWLNLHHFLYNAALAYGESDGKSFTLEKWNELNANEQAIITAAKIAQQHGDV